MITQQTLFETARPKNEIAIDRLREFEPPEGYYLAFSGGKDSQTVYHLAKMAGVKFDAHFNLTTVDPPELVRFIKKEYPDVEIHRPQLTMWQLLASKTMPPTRIVRYCCEVMKEGGGEGRITLLGVRWAESVKRSKRRMVEFCKKAGARTLISPIIDWTTDEVWEFLNENNIPHCSLYDEGQKRIGCIMCPMQGTKGMLKDAARWPKHYNAYLRAFERMMKTIAEKGTKTSWKTAQDVMDWWIYNPPKGDPDQTVLFE